MINGIYEDLNNLGNTFESLIREGKLSEKEFEKHLIRQFCLRKEIWQYVMDGHGRYYKIIQSGLLDGGIFSLRHPGSYNMAAGENFLRYWRYIYDHVDDFVNNYSDEENFHNSIFIRQHGYLKGLDIWEKCRSHIKYVENNRE